MGVELNINGKEIELSENTRFQFNYTVNDIFNIGTIAVGYSNVFEAPKTPSNTRTLEGLGIVGSTSRIPYKKTHAVVKYDGFDIIPNGLMTVESTAVNYKLGVHDGVMDFFKDIENKTIGNDVVGIEELKHRKDIANFKNSITDNNSLYRYAVADFGGKMQSESDVINIDYLVPAIKLSFLWDKIFETFGYTYSGSIFSNPDFTEAYITYPNAPDMDNSLVDYATAKKNSYRDNNPVLTNGVYLFPNAHQWDSTTPAVNNPFISNWNFRSPEADTYRIRVKPVGYVMTTRRVGNVPLPVQRPFYLAVKIGNVTHKFMAQPTLSGDFSSYYFDFPMSAGELIEFSIVPNLSLGETLSYLQIITLEVEILKNTLGEYDFADAFTDFGVKYFVKEITTRYGLTPIYDHLTKNIRFLTVDEKINFDNVIDWSDKYVSREEESYLYGSYAQINAFTHKYNEDGDDYNNGAININNSNLDTSKVVYASKIYSAENKIYRYQIGTNEISTNRYPIWKSEVKETSDGVEVDYKGLNGRYYIMKLSRVNQQGKFKSEVLNSNIETTPHYFVPINQMTHYAELVPKYYPKYQEVLNDFKMHKIELALSLPDIMQLDFTKLYYFEQEASLYILNKLPWEDGRTTKGEFIKVNK